MSPRLARLLELVPALVTLALCLWRSGQRQLSRDELATWWAAKLSFPDLGRLIDTVDFVIAPYYVLMHAWLALFGDSLVALRLPSALAMSACAWLVTKLGSALFGGLAGLLAGLLFALVPSVSAFGQDARHYALALLCCTAASFQLKRALEAPESWRRWFAYTGLLVATGAFHIVALTVLAGHAAAVWLLSSSATRRAVGQKWLVAAAVALLAVAPLVYMGSQQTAQIDWIRNSPRRLFDFPDGLFLSEAIASMVMCVGLLGLGRAGRSALWLGVWAIFPPFFLFVTSDALHLFLPRYMLFTLPAWIVLAAHGMSSTLRLRQWLPAFALLVAFSVHGQAPLRVRTPKGYFDYNTVALAIEKEAQPGDAVAFEGPRASSTRIAFRYLLRKSPKPLRDVFAVGTAEEIGSWTPELCRDAERCLSSDVKRLWLVTTSTEDVFEDMPKDLARALSPFARSEARSAPKLSYMLLTRVSSDVPPVPPNP